ncbi:MAG TPA: hypothetical protein VKV37_16815 [Ktedonobacteraceae bacterium]|jgi:ATP/maltotriose-dependent transcriptional regulator MalT|nr:hypothetical protein [Ktedonobacteraceae bacterium]
MSRSGDGSMPGLPLARWRMRGQMVESRETVVRFTSEEAHRFL